MLPFSVMSYLLGMTAVRFRDYLIGSFGVAFHVAMFIYAGSTLTYLNDEDSSSQTQQPKSKLETTVMILQAILAVGLAVYISRLAKKELDKRLERSSDEEAPQCPVKVKQKPSKLV